MENILEDGLAALAGQKWFEAKIDFKVYNKDAAVAELSNGEFVWISGAVKYHKGVTLLVRIKPQRGVVGEMTLSYIATEYKVQP
jgi:hypothetical protein